MKILCGIITFNREKLLNRCLSHIGKLTLKPNLVLIINQGNSITIKNNQSLDIEIINQENMGSAGGWFTAIDYAVKENYDYIWLMDDDGYPEKKSLEILFNNYKHNYACLSSVVIDESNKKKLVFNMPYYNKKLLLRTKNFNKLKYFKSNSSNQLYPHAHLFNGSLISLQAVKSIGNVTKNLFIYGEEVDYFNRLKKYGPVYTLLESKHYHPSVKKKYTSDEVIYFWLRNTIINNNNYSKYKILKNIVIFFINIFKIFERNGFIFIIKLFTVKSKSILLKAFFDAHRFKPDRNE